MANNLRTLASAELQGKTVVVRANLDVPFNDHELADDTAIKASLPTLQHLLKHNCKVIIIAHLGDPQGKYDDELSLMPVRFELGRQLGKQLKFVDIKQCENSIKFMENGEVILLENIRFNPEEQSESAAKRTSLIKKLGEISDLYINDCFALTAKHASVYELAKILPSYAGLSFEKEYDYLTALRKDTAKPFVVIAGGVDLQTKVEALKYLVDQADTILIGGKIAYTFMSAQGLKTGSSFVDAKLIKDAKAVLTKAKKNKCKIVLPVDHIALDETKPRSKAVKVKTSMLTKDLVGVDIGPETVKLFEEELIKAKTVVWDGALGIYENEAYSNGTETIGEVLTLRLAKEVVKVVGGKSTLAALKKLKLKTKRFTHVSVADEMMLHYIGNEKSEVLKILTGSQKL